MSLLTLSFIYSYNMDGTGQQAKTYLNPLPTKVMTDQTNIHTKSFMKAILMKLKTQLSNVRYGTAVSWRCLLLFDNKALSNILWCNDDIHC